MRHIGLKVKIVGFCVLVIGVYALYSATHPALAEVTGACLYTVQVGDELKGIASTHNIGTMALYDQNKGVIGQNPDLIYPGEHLNVCLNDNDTTYKAASQSIANPSTAPATYDIRQDIMSVFGAYGNQAIHIAICESGLNPNAIDPIMVYWNGVAIGHARGIFQIVDATFAGTPYGRGSVYDAHTNILAAHWLFTRDGHNWAQEWSTWRCALGY